MVGYRPGERRADDQPATTARDRGLRRRTQLDGSPLYVDEKLGAPHERELSANGGGDDESASGVHRDGLGWFHASMVDQDGRLVHQNAHALRQALRMRSSLKSVGRHGQGRRRIA